jgi:hypothetical protein
MTLEITPELGVELTPDIDYLDLRERAEAMCRSVLLLEQYGLDTAAIPEDEHAAATITAAYASNPEKISKTVSTVRASSLTPASLVAIRSYLNEYGQRAVTHAVELRNLVTNRLLEESQNPDARVRIRALELLGKHSDVGLFTEKQEMTVTHQSTDELRVKLKEKLQRLVNRHTPEDGVEDAVVLGDEIIDVGAELGFGKRKPEVLEPEDDLDPDDPDGVPWVKRK